MEEILFGHIILSNVHQVKTLLKYGVSPNCQDEHGNTPLHVLVANDRLSVNDPGDESWVELLRLLVYHGAHVDSRNNLQMTPLMIAAINGHARMVAHLVQSNCDVNLQNAEGNTALFSAVSRGHADVVDILLRSGRCDLNKSRRQPSSIIQTVRKPYDVVENLFRNTHATNRVVDPMLIVASARGHNDIVLSLLNYGFDVDVIGKFQKTALHHAARCGHVEITRALIDVGAKLDVQDNMGMTPLLLAAGKGFLQRYRVVMALLIEAGCDINKTDIHGRNIFHIAAAQGCADIIHLLLTRGEFYAVETSTFRGVTPMLNAVRSNRPHVIKVLLSFNCSIHSKFLFQSDSRPTLWFPLHDGYLDIALLLIMAGADLNALLAGKPANIYSSWVHRNIRDSPHTTRLLTDVMTRPRSLSELCRIQIRKSLTHRAHQEVTQLSLPSGIQDYILMKKELSDVQDLPLPV